MRSPRLFASLLLLVPLLATPKAAHGRDLFTRVSPLSGRAATLSVRPQAPLLAVDRAALDELRASDGGTVSVPLADGTSLDLVLERRRLFAPGAQVTYTDASGPHALPIDLAFFRGSVPGEPDTWAEVTLAPNQVRATIVRGSERLDVMPAEAPTGTEPPLHVLSPERDLDSTSPPWSCGVDGANEAALDHGDPTRLLPRPPAQPNGVELVAPRRVISIAVDCDQEIAGKFGGNVTAASNYVTTLLATVSLIYERDLEVTLNVSYLNFWTTTDPYTQTSLSPQLSELRSWWNANRSGIPRAVTHLLSGRNLGGGIAYLNVLCASTSSGYGYSLSAIDCAYGYPTNTSTWDAVVVAHELGHNFAAYHTHSCNWGALGYVPAGATLDSCQVSEGGCWTSPPVPLHVPPAKGTIMSYCHLLSGGVAGNIRLDFHPVCIERMRAAVDAAPCASDPTVQPPDSIAIAATPTGAELSWLASTTPGVTGYDVYRSRYQLDPDPAFIGSTAGLSFDDVSLGTWYYKVRAYTGGDTSAFGAETHLALCPLEPQPDLPVGSTPVAIAAADFDGDGITDLAVANQGEATVSLIHGNGSGGVGDGTFAAAVPIATVSGAQCLLATDVTGDGLLDLVVGTGVDSSLWIYPGGGAAGVPNGTFGGGTRVPLGFIPTSVATADFNEDGLPDFVVAGHPTGVGLLFGNGTDGVPDGTFTGPTILTFTSLPGPSRGVTIADFNEDGIWDFAVTTSTYLRVYRGLGTNGVGDGTFAAPAGYNAFTNAYEIITGDFNQDGITDLLTLYSPVSGAGVFFGNGTNGVGTGTFPYTATGIDVGSNPRGVAVGDWNGDGLPDLALVNNNTTKTASVVTGKGGGQFDPALTWGANTNPYALALGDWNHDGGIDLAVVNRGANSVTPMLAACVNALPLDLSIVEPAGPDTLIETVDHALSWSKGAGVGLVEVQVSRDGGTTWETIAQNRFDTTFTWTPTPPATTHARLRVVDQARRWVMAESASDFTILPQAVLDVGTPVATRFAVLGAWPNPTRGSFSVSLSLPEGGRGARLELLDLAGRRVADVPLGAFAPGVHSVPLQAAGLRPGVYLVRLSQSGRASTRKVAVLD